MNKLVPKALLVLCLCFLFQIPSLFCQEYLDEYLVLPWNDAGSWYEGNRYEEKEMITIEVFRRGETPENWSEMGGMTTYRKLISRNVIQLKDYLKNDAMRTYNPAKLTVIDVDSRGNIPNPWIIFSIECKNWNQTGKPRSILMHVIKGWEHTFVSWRVMKTKKIPKDVKKQWIKFFRQATIEPVSLDEAVEASGIEKW